MGRPLRPRKEVDYRSAGVGAPEPSWLKVTALTPFGLEHGGANEAENINPQTKQQTGKRHKPMKSASTGRISSKPNRYGLTHRKKDFRNSSSSRRLNNTVAHLPNKSRIGKIQTTEKSHDKSALAKPGNNRSSKSSERVLRNSSRTPDTDQRRSNTTASGHPSKENRQKEGASACGELGSAEADQDTGIRSGAAPDAAENSVAAVQEQRQQGVSRTRPAKRGRNAGLIIMDMDDAGHTRRKQKTTATKEGQAVVPAQDIIVGRSGCERAVWGLPGVSQKLLHGPSPDAAGEEAEASQGCEEPRARTAAAVPVLPPAPQPAPPTTEQQQQDAEAPSLPPGPAAQTAQQPLSLPRNRPPAAPSHPRHSPDAFLRLQVPLFPEDKPALKRGSLSEPPFSSRQGLPSRNVGAS